MNILNNPKKYFWITLFQSSYLLSSVLTLFYLQKGLDYFQIFTLLIAIVVSMFIFEVPTGIIGDKYGRKVSIIFGLIGWIVFNIALLFATSYFHFLLLFVLMGLSITFFSGSDEALIYDSLKQVKKQKEMSKWWGKITSARFIPMIIFPPIASYIAKDLKAFQFSILILGDLLFMVIALFIAFTLVEPKISSGPHEMRSPLELLRSSVYHIRKSPKLVRLFMNKTLILIPGSHIFMILWQPYLLNSGIAVFYFGIVIALGSILVVLATHNTNKIQVYISDKKLLFYTGLLPLLAFALGAIFQNILVALIFYFTIRLTIWLREPIFSQYMNSHIKSHNRATVLSSLSMIDSLFDVIIFLSAGFITNISISYSFLFSAGLMLIALVFFRVTREHIKVTT